MPEVRRPGPGWLPVLIGGGLLVAYLGSQTDLEGPPAVDSRPATKPCPPSKPSKPSKPRKP